MLLAEAPIPGAAPPFQPNDGPLTPHGSHTLPSRSSQLDLLSPSKHLHPPPPGAFRSQALCMPIPLQSQKGTAIQQPMDQA